MDYSELKTIKEMYDGMIGFFDTVENQGLYSSPIKDVRMSTILMIDLIRFMLYLSASDGSIDYGEVEAFRYITGLDVSGREMVDLIKEHNVYSTQFESQVPVAMQIAVNSGIQFNANGNRLPLAVLLFEFYKMLGTIMVTANDEVAENEKNDFAIYLTTLASYLAKNGFRVS